MMTDKPRRLRGPAKEIDRRTTFLERRITDAIAAGQNPTPERIELAALAAAQDALDRQRWRSTADEIPPADATAKILAVLRGGAAAVLRPEAPGVFYCLCGCRSEFPTSALDIWCFAGPSPKK